MSKDFSNAYILSTGLMQETIPSIGKGVKTNYITSPGHETPLASGVSTNVSVDVDTRQHDSEADVDARQHDLGQDQDQPAFN
eukprot:scaffold3362_cov154-Amphora_coffeaeformis.AAC.7